MNITLGVAHYVYVFPALTLECLLKYYISNTKSGSELSMARRLSRLNSPCNLVFKSCRVGGRTLLISKIKVQPPSLLWELGNKMMVIRKTLVVLLAVVVLSAGATLTQAQRRNHGTFRSVRQLMVRIENRTDVFRNSLDAQSQGG